MSIFLLTGSHLQSNTLFELSEVKQVEVKEKIILVHTARSKAAHQIVHFKSQEIFQLLVLLTKSSAFDSSELFHFLSQLQNFTELSRLAAINDPNAPNLDRCQSIQSFHRSFVSRIARHLLWSAAPPEELKRISHISLNYLLSTNYQE